MRPYGLTATVLVLAALGACGDSESPGVSSTQPYASFVLTDESPRLLLATLNGGGGGDAQVIGQLEYLSALDCFVLDGFGDDTYRVAVAWPEGTTATAAGLEPTVSVPDFGEIRTGDWLLGAGYYDNPEGALPELPTGCLPSETEFAVLYGVDQAGPESLLEN